MHPTPIASPTSTFTSSLEKELEFPPPLRRRQTHETQAHGYPKLSWWVGKEPGFAIFRRFASLNAKNLLYYQAEIAQLEVQLQDLEHLNARENESLQTQVSELMSAKPGTNAARQWEKVLEIRAKLRDYNHLLLEHNQLYSLPEPNESDYEQLRNFLYHTSEEGPWLKHPEDIWAFEDGQKLHHDLVALSSRNVGADKFTRWLVDTAVPWVVDLVARRRGREGDHVETDDKMLNFAVGTFATIFASLLPTASIFALYAIHETLNRLAFIMVFSFFFTTCLAVFTDAKRIEIFAAAVALASVQVVFVGTSDGPMMSS
ncbi:hypothetical protein BDY21DRAFT_368156 [Lineolata rhizophorae]|uniref:DUF6594 domain-containing protein n=1 Tax=Lineolata rhizophorae TaxID=578093 RepID=A0A6A6PE29_9PEZI|nr:hypothetical protein BDY21DRAFT_368156 [Lineolata rhizophorae]